MRRSHRSNSCLTSLEFSAVLSASPPSLPQEFNAIDTHALMAVQSWQAKYKLLMNWGNSLSVKPWLRQDEFLVRGCDTALWLYGREADGVFHFAADGDSRIIKGLAALLLAQVNGLTKAEILALDLEHNLTTFGLERHLAPSRSNGFAALVIRLQQLVHFVPEAASPKSAR